jgi:hypothetical protein
MIATLFDGVACLVAAASIGSMVFFSAVVAPNVFRTIPAEHAGAFLRALFPHYFLLNGLASLVCAGMTGQSVAGALFALSGVAMLLVRFILIPQINAARDSMLSGTKSAKDTFDRLHGLSVVVNVAEIIAMAAAIFLIAQH